MQVFQGSVCQPPAGGNITIIVAKFNKTITQRLLDGAIAKLHQHNVRDDEIRVVWVPGAYELPFMADHFAKDPKCHAIICLGAVIKGDTSHDQHINRFVSMSLGELAHSYSKPIIFGVITCDNVEQANARSGIIESEKDKAISPSPGNKGAEAAEAALAMIDLLEEVPSFHFADSSASVFSQIMQFETDREDDDEDSFPPPKKRVKKTRRGKEEK